MKKSRMFAKGIMQLCSRNLSLMLYPIFVLVLSGIGAVQMSYAETIVSADIKSSTTWTLAGSPYHVTKSIGMCHATLAIEPGVVVKFNPGTGIDVCFGGGTDQAIKAVGTADKPILFTSSQAAPAPGDWENIRVISSEDIFQYCIFEFGGAGSNEMVLIDGAAATFSNCQFRKSKSSGARVINNATPSITSSRFSENNLSGLILNNGSASAVIRDNLFDANKLNPVVLGANSLSALRSNVFSGNTPNSIQISAGTIRTNQIVANMGVPYVVSGGYMVLASAVMTIEPGVIMQFDSGSGITYAGTMVGVLNAVGEPHNPILFTSNQRTPAPGDWGGIAIAQPSVLKYCIQEFGGQDGYGVLIGGQLSGSKATVQNSSIRKNSTNGLAITGLFSDSGPLVELNNLYENQGYDLLSEASAKVVARNNWWGNASYTPRVGGNVNVSNPLSTPQLLGFPQSPLIRYFPHYVAGGSYRTMLLLKNLEIIPSVVVANFYDDSGSPKNVIINSVIDSTHRIRIPAGGSKVVEVMGTATNSGWIKLAPEQRIDASLIFQSSENGKVNAAAGVPASSLVQEVSISVLNNMNIYETTGFALSNPNEMPIVIMAELFDDLGIKQREAIIRIPALGHLARFAHEIFTQANEWTGTMKLSSDFGFTVLPMKFDGDVFSTIAATTLR
jgi:hypothetical protein